MKFKRSQYGNDFFYKFVTFIIVVSPMFLQYSFVFPFVLFPEIFFFFAMLAVSIRRTDINIPFFFLVVTIVYYLLVISFIKYNVESYVALNLSLTTSLRLLFYFSVLIFLSNKYFLRSFAAKLLVVVATFNSVYGLLQFFSFKFLGISLPWYLPFLNVQHGQRLITEQDYIFEAFGFRFSGLFSEPAHFSQYIGFGFLVLLFYDKGTLVTSTKKLFLSVLFLLALLLSASGTGFFVLAFIFLVFFLKLMFSSLNLKNFILGSSFFIFSSCAIFLLISSSEIFYLGIERVFNFSDTSSFYVRVFRPFIVFFSLDYIDMFFGVGYGNYSNYVFYKGMENAYESYLGLAWTNSLGVFLVGSGVLGTSLIFSIYAYLFRKTDQFGKLALCFVLVHFLFSDLPHSIFFVCFVSFVFDNERSLTNSFKKVD
jgi:hypothetical protein